MSDGNLVWYKFAALLMVLALIIPILAACDMTTSSTNPSSTNLSPASTSQADGTNSSSSPTFYLRITDTNLVKLNDFESHRTEAYNPVSPSGTLLSKLRWDKYGENLEVYLSKNGKSSPTADGYTQFDYPGVYDYLGECVSAVRALSGNGSEYPTSAWEKGPRVMGAMDESVTPGTVIATFSGKNNPEFSSGIDHTAIFKGKYNNGFEVWDQNWQFLGVFGTHNINASGSASGTSNANNYYVVQVNNTVLTTKTATTPTPTTSAYLGTTIQYTGSIATSGDYQDWKFSGQAGDIITIRMFEDGGTSLYPCVTLFDPSGSRVSSDSGDSEARIANYKLVFSGTYTIRASSDNWGPTGGYRLLLNKN